MRWLVKGERGKGFATENEQHNAKEEMRGSGEGTIYWRERRSLRWAPTIRPKNAAMQFR